ncbi:MAG: hypothetical protein IJM13_04325 [Lachnospiraceae bacterium]|nr:hypothetical protein [Lachnospiraceae bacterium]
MKYDLFSIITLAWILAGILFFFLAPRSKRIFFRRHPLWYFIVVVFVALVLHLLPLSYEYYRPDIAVGGPTAFLTALQSVQNALRTFVLDGAWGEWMSIRHLSPVYSVLGIILSVAAPILTFSVILSALYTQFARIDLRAADFFGRPLHIMSELNERSLALARDITKDNDSKKLLEKTKVIFTDVFERNEEDNYELRREAKDMGASFIKADIRNIKLNNRLGEVNYYVLGEDETENLSQALTIYSNHKDKARIKLFVWVGAENADLLDSNTGDILKDQAEKGYAAVRQTIENEEYLIMRRIEDARMLVRGLMVEPFQSIFEKKDPSVLLVGAGRFGREIFRTLIWFLQREDSCPEINVMDKKRSGGHIGFREWLMSECPELAAKNDLRADGEACYSFRVFDDVDVFGTIPDRGPGGEDYRARLMKTDAVIVSIGEDHKNLSAAVRLRTYFRRAGIEPDIYAVINDDMMAKTIPVMETNAKENYNIIPIGGRDSLYRYSHVFDKKLEKQSFRYHTLWIETAVKETASQGGSFDVEDAKTKELVRYEQKEYFRLSSATRSFHENACERAGLHPCENGYAADSDDRLVCTCGNCMLRRKQEHMRWNAFMRGQGYILGPKKDHIAKTHPNLVPFSELSETDKNKDS